jgi:hypothetical protein
MIIIPAIAILPSLPMPDLAVGFVTVMVLATTGTLAALAVLIAGLVGERRETRILFRHRTPTARPHVRSAA